MRFRFDEENALFIAIVKEKRATVDFADTFISNL